MESQNFTLTVLAVIALLAANAFFVAAEFALVKVRGFQLRQRAESGSRAARLTMRMHADLDAYLAACQLGITMASLGLGWVGEPAVAALLEPILTAVGIQGDAVHTISFVTGFLLFSSLHIVVGEQVPKTYAIRRPARVSVALALPLQLFYWFAYPLNWSLNKINAVVLRLLGVRGSVHHEVISEDEISAIVVRSQAQGEIEEKTADIIRKAFLFDDQTAKGIMVPWASVRTLRINAPVAANIDTILKTRHSRFPVMDDEGSIIGLVAVKDLSVALLQKKTDVWPKLKQFLREPMMIPESMLISSLMEQMRQDHVHMAVVVNEFGSHVGIVTMEDMLEEIVGEIEDEWDDDPQQSPLEQTDDGWIASGQLAVDVLESALGSTLDVPEGCGTVGGLLMGRMQKIPQSGDQCVVGYHLFEVMEMDDMRVARVRITEVDAS